MRLIGFRAHRLGNEGRLYAVNDRFGWWDRGQNEAARLAMPAELTGAAHLEIGLWTPHGFHAYYKEPVVAVSSWYGYPSPHAALLCVQTAVTGWGRMVLHSDGWRAQFAEIHAVLSTQDRAVDEAIRKRYDVAIVQYPDELREIALKYGTEVTDPSAEVEGVQEIEKAAPREEQIAGYYMGQPVTPAQAQWLRAQPGFPWLSASHLAPSLPIPTFTGLTSGGGGGYASIRISGNMLTAPAPSWRPSGHRLPTDAEVHAAEQAAARAKRVAYRVYFGFVIIALALANVSLVLTSHIRPPWSMFSSSAIAGMAIGNAVRSLVLALRRRPSPSASAFRCG